MRYFFHLGIRDGKQDQYRERHMNVWPEMTEELRKSGITSYSIYLRGTDVYGYWECESLGETLSFLEKSEVNSRWQEFMSDIIKESPEEGMKNGFEEVFHLE